MSAFKDAVSKDVKAVFINLDEFADEHTLDGKTISCIVDKDLTTGVNDTISHPIEGVFVTNITIYVDAKDMDTQPVEGQQIVFDDEYYFVRNVSVEAGIYAIVAEVNRQ